MLGFEFGENPAGVPLTPIGWPIDPEAFSETLLAVHQSYDLPIYVLENGYGNDDKPGGRAIIGTDRVKFLRLYWRGEFRRLPTESTLAAIFIWSLLDNFEWDAGYSIRFGLTYVDYPSLRRYSENIVPLVRRSDHGIRYLNARE